MANKTKLKITGNWDGNIFAVMGNTKRELRNVGRADLVAKVMDATKCDSYDEALGVCVKLLEEAGFEVC